MAGFTHGDGQPKNVAFDSHDTPVYTDLETASKPQTAAHHRYASKKDTADFMQFQLAPLSPREVAEHFTTTYMEQHARAGVAPLVNAEDLAEVASLPVKPLARFGSAHNRHVS